MIVRRVLMGLVVLVVVFQAAPADAQQCSAWHAFWQSVARDWRRNNCWPEAFLGPDRLAVRAPFVVMVENGWRRQNLLSNHHFEEEATTLNQAGKLKVRWIMTQAPKQHRTIYVRRADAPEDTAARIAGVQEYGVQFAEDGQLPEVRETNLDTTGWPAAEVDMIHRKAVDTAPDPRLPKDSGGGEGSD